MWTVSLVHADDALRWQPRLQRVASVKLVLEPGELKLLSPWPRFSEAGKQLSALPAGIVFSGSASLHHLSYHLALRQGKPLTAVVFDRHGDYLPSPPGHVSCGSWLLELVKRPEVEEAWLVGSEGPCRPVPSPKLRVLSARRAREMLATAQLAARQVYVSIDKDVLQEAVTDWGSGRLESQSLFELLSLLRDRYRLVGVDVCGEIIPSGCWPTDSELRAIRTNEEINLRLCRLLLDDRRQYLLHSRAS
ncbi:MAG: hypothetical protein QHH27_06740 [Clostridia bacterium]|jgi:agmatinase|nr:hypothetical protein [Clostridia bacterium]MDH7573228.1 hypothetical protein [Clostridia bacterium]